MSLNPSDVFVIIKWPEDAGLPRYSFATMPHAAEIQHEIERIQTCSSIEMAASLVERLNAQESGASA
jgi:hypothetical protein